MATATPDVAQILEAHRRELTGHCYRMLGSTFDAEDAVQETLVRAWRGYERFEGRAALRSWLYKIATNVCLDMLKGDKKRITPMELGPAQEPVESNLRWREEIAWLEPIPNERFVEPDPADVAASREDVRLAFVAALQRLPAKQRAVLILCEVLKWKAAEVGELLDMSVASVNSALQRARATLKDAGLTPGAEPRALTEAEQAIVDRFADAFQRYDVTALTALIKEDATQSMPPFDMWLAGRDDILTWWFGPGIACQGSRLIPTKGANGRPAWGQYKPSPSGGYEPWSLVVIEPTADGISEFTFFLDTARLFPLFGLPAKL